MGCRANGAVWCAGADAASSGEPRYAARVGRECVELNLSCFLLLFTLN